MSGADPAPGGPAGGRVLLGCALMLAGTVVFASMHGLVRLLTQDLHPFEVAFFRCFFGLLMLAPWLLARRRDALRTRRLPLHLTRAMLNVLAMLAFFYALSITPIALVQALSFTAPLFTTILAVFLLGESVRLRRWSAVAVGFVGALVIIRPGFQALDLGAVLTVVSAAVWALCMVIIKRVSSTDSSLTITAYMVILMSPLSLIPALFVWTWPEGVQWLLLAGCGLLGTAAQWLLAQALRVADATVVLPLDFAKLIWGALIGYVFFAELVDVWTWIGATIIFGGATYIALRERSLQRRAAASQVRADPA